MYPVSEVRGQTVCFEFRVARLMFETGRFLFFKASDIEYPFN